MDKKLAKAISAKIKSNKIEYADSASSPPFSDSDHTNYIRQFRLRLNIFTGLIFLSLALQVYVHVSVNMKKDDVLHATTFNGVTFKLPKPYSSLDEAVLANKLIPENLDIIFKESGVPKNEQ